MNHLGPKQLSQTVGGLRIVADALVCLGESRVWALSWVSIDLVGFSEPKKERDCVVDHLESRVCGSIWVRK